MPRTARISLPGGVFHVVSRFARDIRWLDRPGARANYLRLLGKAVEACDVEILGYCLMSNHVHLVVVQGQAPLARFTKSLHTGFAQWVNSSRRGKAQGPVYAGRPRQTLVDRESYLLALVRYVHNNPVRARVVRFARNSGWSSHRAYTGRVAAPPWLRVGYVLERFGRDPTRAAERFDAFVDAGRKEQRRPELSGTTSTGEAAATRRLLGDGHRMSDGVLGSKGFVDSVRADAQRVEAALSSRGSERRAGPVGRPDVREVIDAVLQLLELDAIALEQQPRTRAVAQAKQLAIWVWVHEYAGRQVDIARALSLDTSVVSRHYGRALREAGEFDQQASAVTALLRKQRRARGRTVTAATASAQAVRYHVDVEET